MFLNCNYPNQCRIPKGKPKFKSHFMMRYNNTTLYETTDGTVYLEETESKGYYFGIDIGSFLVKNAFGICVWETICKIETALLEWNGETLSNGSTDILQKYLRTLR